MSKAKKAVIFARVSSNEQEYGKSLAAQLEQGYKYAEHNELEVIKAYEIVESSTRGKRVKFNEMLMFVQAQKEPIAIISHTVDRFQRRFDESVELTPLVRAGKIELHFVAQGLVLKEDSPEYLFTMWDFNVMGAKAYISQLKENTKRGIKKKIEDGEWPTLAPLGYLNYNEGKYRKIKVDEDRAPKIQRMFEEMATGLYSIDEVGRRAIQNGLTTRRGNPLSRNAVHKIINNPFYYGEMRTKKGVQQHIYPTLISKELFDKCQSVKRKEIKGSVVRKKQNNYVFKGLIKCGVCGHLVSPYTKTKKSGKTYIYLRCACHALNSKCSNPEITEKQALETISESLAHLNIGLAQAEELQQHLIRYSHSHTKEKRANIKISTEELSKVKKQIDSLIDLRLNGSLSENLFQEKLSKLQNQQTLLENKLADNQMAEELDISLDEVLDLAKNAKELFVSSQIEEKREILSCIFANFQLQGKNLYFSYKKPFDLLVKGPICTEFYRGRDLNP